jgi:hypothetical protein
LSQPRDDRGLDTTALVHESYLVSGSLPAADCARMIGAEAVPPDLITHVLARVATLIE